MYNSIFYYFYKLALKKGQDPRLIGSGQVTITQWLQVFFVASVLKYFYKLNLPRFSDDYFHNKLYVMPFILAWGVIVYLYYNKDRITEILNRRDADSENLFSFKNTAKVLSLMIVPLLLGILFLKLGQSG